MLNGRTGGWWDCLFLWLVYDALRCVYVLPGYISSPTAAGFTVKVLPFSLRRHDMNASRSLFLSLDPFQLLTILFFYEFTTIFIACPSTLCLKSSYCVIALRYSPCSSSQV